ncbi:MAG: patatin family protein [Thermoguttaceae bacterium]|nr:patatin family protein [Thermoguttaceae bacterium]
MKKGLVLEGGALRGIFTAGVLDVFLENNISFDGMVGVSAGAVFGCNFKSRQPGRTVRYNTRFCRSWKYASFLSLFLTGNLYGTKFCYHDIPERLDPFDLETFQNNSMEFHLVTTDTETGYPLYHRCGDDSRDVLMDWFRASASMPIVSKTVKIGGKQLLDGGISDSIPLRYFQENGFEKNVVILTQPPGFQKKKIRFTPLIRFLLRKHPNVFQTLLDRHSRYNSQLAYVQEQKAAGNTFVIQPPAPLGIGPIERDANRIREVYQTGRAEGEKCLPEIKHFLN